MSLTPATTERIILWSIVGVVMVSLGGLAWYEQIKARDVATLTSVSIMADHLAREYTLHARYPAKALEGITLPASDGISYRPLTAQGAECTTTDCDTYVISFSLSTGALGLIRGSHERTPQGIR